MATTVELLLAQQPGGVAIRSYTSLLDQILLALEELDRVAVPGRASRPEWAVRDISTAAGQLRLLLSPRTLAACTRRGDPGASRERASRRRAGAL